MCHMKIVGGELRGARVRVPGDKSISHRALLLDAVADGRTRVRGFLAGADCLATGHYVQRRMGANGPELHRGADPSRDQSYFLFATTREQLKVSDPDLSALVEETMAYTDHQDWRFKHYAGAR